MSVTPAGFAKNVYSGLMDLEFFFLTILLGVFVVFQTFSEKIVNFSAATWWSKILLLLCWVFVLISIIGDETGMFFLQHCYVNETIRCDYSHRQIFEQAFIFIFPGTPDIRTDAHQHANSQHCLLHCSDRLVQSPNKVSVQKRQPMTLIIKNCNDPNRNRRPVFPVTETSRFPAGCNDKEQNVV